jgi:hypothetical protein
VGLIKFLEDLQLDKDNAKVFRGVLSIFTGMGAAAVISAFGANQETSTVVLLSVIFAVWLWLRVKVNWH